MGKKSFILENQVPGRILNFLPSDLTAPIHIICNLSWNIDVKRQWQISHLNEQTVALIRKLQLHKVVDIINYKNSFLEPWLSSASSTGAAEHCMFKGQQRDNYINNADWLRKIKFDGGKSEAEVAGRLHTRWKHTAAHKNTTLSDSETEKRLF